MNQRRGGSSRGPVAGTWWIGSVATLLVLVGPVSTLQAEPCRVTVEQNGFKFPVEQLDPAALCLIEPIVNRATTSGLVGPITTPIPQPLYVYLLDRPVIIASLGERYGLGSYQFTVKGPNQFWGNDGDGTQGLITLLYQDQKARLYHIDGYHEGHLFPLVRVKALVFLRTTPVTTPEGHPAVETSLVAYTRLNDPVLSALLSLLKPLVGDAIIRKLTRGFEVTTQLGLLIAKDPDRIVQEIRILPLIQPEDQRMLTLLLQELPKRTSSFQPTRTPVP